MPENDKPGVRPAGTAKDRLAARRKAAGTPRQPSPTRVIEPGIVHYRIAEGILKQAQARAEAAGLPLDVGEFPEVDATATEQEDPQRVVKLTAHAVARVADRFSFVRKLSRHMEGQNARAGLLSDIAAVVFSLYKRNPAVVEQLAQQFAADLQTQRATRKAPSNGGAPQHPEGVL